MSNAWRSPISRCSSKAKAAPARNSSRARFTRSAGGAPVHFVAVNCAALVETLLEAELFGIEERTATGVRGRQGKFEHAEGGTLFLDEISDLSLSAQAKLLRAIQDVAVERVGGHGSRRVNTRIVAATNRSLSDMVARGLFRTDLYYRLGGVEIHVPPLRARREDISELARYFLSRHSQRARPGAVGRGRRRAAHLRAGLATCASCERFIERAVALTDSRLYRARRPSAAIPRRLCAGPRTGDRRRAIRCARGAAATRGSYRALRAQQAACLPASRHQLSHARGVSPLLAARRRRRQAVAGVGAPGERTAMPCKPATSVHERRQES